MDDQYLAKVPGSVTGLWGEAVVVLELRKAGFTVEWDGGMTRGRDLRASRENTRTLQIQVKTTSAKHGGVNWRKDGAPARQWGQSVSAREQTPLYVFVHFTSSATTHFNLETGVLEVALPKYYTVHAVDPETFASHVDEARAEYGTRTRQKDDRFGKQGDPLTPDGLQYPVSAGDYPKLSDALTTENET